MILKSLENLLEIFSKRKIFISLDGSEQNLRLTGNTESLSSEDKELLRTKKQDLILFLKERKIKNEERLSHGVAQQSIPKSPENDSYPVTPSQSRFWFISQLEEASSSYNIFYTMEIEGNIDYNRFQKAFRFLINRHEILRTTFKLANNGELRQFIQSASQINFNIEFEDYSVKKEQLQDINEYLTTKNSKPFDLEKAPLFRVLLIKTAENKHIFYLCIHHIIADGWSMQLIMNEILHYYVTLQNNQSVNIPEIKLQYRDYAVWLTDQFERKNFRSAEKYWLDQFSGEIPVLEIPRFNPRPLQRTSEGKTISHTFSGDFLGQLQRISSINHSTLFMTLFSAVNLLLHKYSGQNEIVIGTPVAGREHPDLEKSIGLYINTLAIKSELDENLTIEDFITLQKTVLLKAFENQLYPFDELVNKLNLKRNLDRSPLFDVMIVLQNHSVSKGTSAQIQDLKINKFDNKRETAQFDITFGFVEHEGKGLEMNVNYNTDIYDQSIIVKMISHFEEIIGQMAENYHVKIKNIQYLTPEEKQQILIEFNDTAVPYPNQLTIVELFENQVIKNPDHIAIIFEDHQLTYKELNEQSNQLGKFLREQYNIQPNDLVGLKLERSEKMMIALLGILKSGAAYVPIDINYPEERITYIQKNSDCKTVLDNALLDDFFKVQHKYSKENPEKINKPSDLAYVIYTSGTTGNPKGVMIEHTSLINRLEWMQKAYQLSETDTLLQKTSYSFDVSVWELFWWIYNGSKLSLLEHEAHKDPKKIIENIGNNKISVLHFVPSMLNVFLDCLDSDRTEIEKLTSLKQVFVSGEALQPDQNAKFFKTFPEVSLMNLYGPTEATIDVSYFECHKELKSVPIGKPIDNIQLYILDNEKQVVPIGVTGKLYISGVGVARGYVNNSRLNKEKFIPNPFISGQRMYDTGDLARWLPDGNIDFLGRKDHQIKLRGFRIELGEIETHLLEYSQDFKQVVVDAKSVNGEQALVAYIATTNTPDKSELRNYLQKKIPDYMIPDFYTILDSIPLNSNGKIDRKALPDITETDLQRKEYIPPTNKVQEILVAIWEEVLGIEPVGITENFFELGGHSLKVIQVINRLKKQHNLKISIVDFFANPTVVSLENKLNETSYEAIPQAPFYEYYPITPSQQRLWVLSQFEGGALAYNISTSIKLIGQFSKEKFEKTLQLLIDKYEILRTAFFLKDDGIIYQKVIPSESLKFTIEEKDFSQKQDAASLIFEYLQNKKNEAFNLEKAPLLKSHIIRLEEEQHIFFLSIHHIIADGWSVELLISEIVEVYNSLINNETPNVKKPRIQYKDYSVWSSDEVRQDQQKISEQYWMDQFKDSLPVLNLPSFKARPLVQTFNGNNIPYPFSDTFLKDLTDFSKKNDVTLFMLLMTSIKILLHKYTNQSDIIIGIPVAGREHPDLENQIGLFLNTLAIRTQLDPKQKISEALMSEKKALLKGYEHQDYSFDELVEKLNIKRDQSRSALFDVMVVLQNQNQLNISNNGKTLENITVEEYNLGAKTAKFDLEFAFTETSDGLILNITYNTDIYEALQIENIFGHLTNILLQTINKQDTLIQEIDYLSEKEKETLLYHFNPPVKEGNFNRKSIVEMFEDQVEKSFGDIALLFKEQKLSYKELNERSNQLANYLREIYHIQPNDLVGVKLERNQNLIIALLAVLKAGGVYVPIDVNYPEERINYIESDIRSKIIIDKTEFDNFFETKENYSSKNLVKTNSIEDLAYIIYTSGTTGNPKGVMIKHSSISSFSTNILNEFHINS